MVEHVVRRFKKKRKKKKRRATVPTLRICTRYLDHVKVAIVGENSIHFAVQLFEGAVDGVGLYVVAALIVVEVMVAWKRRREMLWLTLKGSRFQFPLIHPANLPTESTFNQSSDYITSLLPFIYVKTGRNCRELPLKSPKGDTEATLFTVKEEQKTTRKAFSRRTGWRSSSVASRKPQSCLLSKLSQLALLIQFDWSVLTRLTKGLKYFFKAPAPFSKTLSYGLFPRWMWIR